MRLHRCAFKAKSEWPEEGSTICAGTTSQMVRVYFNAKPTFVETTRLSSHEWSSPSARWDRRAFVLEINKVDNSPRLKACGGFDQTTCLDSVVEPSSPAPWRQDAFPRGRVSQPIAEFRLLSTSFLFVRDRPGLPSLQLSNAQIRRNGCPSQTGGWIYLAVIVAFSAVIERLSRMTSDVSSSNTLRYPCPNRWSGST